MSCQTMPQWVPKAAAVSGAAVLILTLTYLDSRKLTKASGSKATTEAGTSVQAEQEVAGISVKESQVLCVQKYIKDVGSTWKAEASKDEINEVGDLGKYLSFQSEYKTRFAARPDVGEGVLLKVTDWRPLTPEDYDRTCFHVEVDIAGCSIEHLCNGAHCKALSVYATNDKNLVQEFLQAMKLDPHAVVPVDEIAPPEEDGTTVLTTLEKLFTQYLDLFGKPTREFLKKLFAYAVDIQEKVAIAELTLERKME